MGSLAYALGGALQGGGKGLADVGEQGFKEQLLQKQNDLATAREESMVRLRDKFEKENIANQQEFQTKAATAVAAKQSELEHAKLTSEEGRAAAHEKGATERSNIAASAKRYAADQGVARAAATRKPAAEWTRKTLTEQGNVDSKTGAITPGRSYSLLQHNPTGQGMVEVGDKLLPYDASATQFPDGKSVRNAPASDLNDLMQHPERGMAFFRAYHYLPRDWMSKYAEAKQPSAGGVPKFAGNASVGPETSFGGASEEPGEESDTKDEPSEDAGYDTSYHNTGGNPQPSDNEPAK